MNNTMWEEINDSQGEIFDLPELTELKELPEERFNFDQYINSNIDY